MPDKRTRFAAQRGMSMAEILVASAIFLLIVVTALMVYDQSNKIFKTSVESSEMQQNTRAGFDRLVSDVRMAGFDVDRDGVPIRSAAGVWQPLTMYIAGAIVAPTPANGFSYRVVTGGVSGPLQPTNWPTTAGATLTGDGSVTWLALGPVYQQSDEQIEYAGKSAITMRANLNYSTDPTHEHGRETAYEPNGGQFPIVTTSNDEIVTYALRSDRGPNPDTLEFYADVTRPRSVYPGGSPERRVQIPNVDLCANGCNNPPYTLLRFTLDSDGNPTAGTPVASNVRDLKFNYYTDLSGTKLLVHEDETAIPQGAVGGLGQYDPANVGGTANWEDRSTRSSIQSVRLELVGMNEQKDAKYINPNETLPAFQKYRTYSLQSLITPRNLGLSGMSEPDANEPGPPTVTSVCVGACKVTRVAWNPPLTGNVDTYEVRYDTNQNGPYNNIGVVVPGDVITAPVFNLAAGTTYYFKVVAINDNGRTTSNNSLSRAPVNSTRPNPVSSLTATDGTDAQPNQITLTWTAPTDNDSALNNVSCIGTAATGTKIDPAEPIRYRVWRGTTETFNPAATPPEGEVVLDSSVTLQPTGPGGSLITWVDDLNNALGKPPANCKPYWYRVQVYDTCSLLSDPAENEPDGATTGSSTIYPAATSGSAQPAIPGLASSTTKPAAPGDPSIDFTNGNSQCVRVTNSCNVKLVWPAVHIDTSNPTQTITVDQYRIRRERKKAADSTWVFDTVLPVVVNASSDSSLQEGDNVIYHDTTALDNDPNDRRKWYYRYTITALQCGAESDPSNPVMFPENCNLAASTVIQSGASSGDGSLESPWVMGASDYITVIPPPSIQLDTVEFEVYPEPDLNPNNQPIDRRTANSSPFVYSWENQTNGEVFRVVITMTNAAGCTEQTERFIQDDPVACPSSTVTQTGSSQGSGIEAFPWLMDAGDTITVNAPAGGPITSVTFQLFKNPGNSLVGTAIVDTVAPYTYTWTNQTDNQDYRLEMTILYVDQCVETLERYVTDEPPPVCSGATTTVSGAASGSGTSGSPWVLNGGDAITIVPPTNGNINQVVFTVTPVTPAGAALPATTDSSSPFTLTWSDLTDNTVYRVDAVITYAPGCTETVTRYVQDQVCSGAVVTQVGSTGAGTGMTTASPWVMNNNDVVTVAPPSGTTISSVQFQLFNEPGTTALQTTSDNSSPYTYTWSDRTDDALYRLEITVTYTAGCTEVLKRYIRDQSSCFITASAPSVVITTTTSGSQKFATITFQISNASNEDLTIKGIQVGWLLDAAHPSAFLDTITFGGTTTISVPAANGLPPTTGLLTVTPTPSVITGGTSSYTVAMKFDIGKKNVVTDLTSSWINSLCIKYSAPSFGGGTASCNVLGSITGNPTSCN